MLKDQFSTRVMFDTPADGGVGSGPEGGESDADIAASFQRLVDRLQTPDKAAWQLFRENYSQREQLRTANVARQAAEAQVAELSKKLPTEGSVALTAEQAAIWQKAISEAGGPEKLPTILEEHKALQVRVAEQERDNVLQSVAAAANVKFEVLKDLDRSQGGLVYAVTPANGTVSAVVAVKTPTGDVDFATFAADKWQHYLPALQAPVGSNFHFPRQSAGSSNPGSSVLETFIKQQQESAAAKPNPLRRKT